MWFIGSQFNMVHPRDGKLKLYLEEITVQSLHLSKIKKLKLKKREKERNSDFLVLPINPTFSFLKRVNFILRV